MPDEVVLFVNNLGGISLLEMGAIDDETVNQLGESYVKCFLFLNPHHQHAARRESQCPSRADILLLWHDIPECTRLLPLYTEHHSDPSCSTQ